VSDDRVAAPLRPTRPAVLADVTAVAGLHMDRFPQGFLPTLGSRPLQRLYRHLVESAKAFVLVASDAEGVNVSTPPRYDSRTV
jgi:hypothetical protein